MTEQLHTPIDPKHSHLAEGKNSTATHTRRFGGPRVLDSKPKLRIHKGSQLETRPQAPNLGNNMKGY